MLKARVPQDGKCCLKEDCGCYGHVVVRSQLLLCGSGCYAEAVAMWKRLLCGSGCYVEAVAMEKLLLIPIVVECNIGKFNIALRLMLLGTNGC